MNKLIVIGLALLLFPRALPAEDLTVMVRDAETLLPINKATVEVIVFNEKDESWRADWWGSDTKENGIVTRLELGAQQQLVIRVGAEGYFSTFYGRPFFFYGVPVIITLNEPSTRVEVYLQPIREPSKHEMLRTVKK